MNTLARELAMAFLENRTLKMSDTVVTMGEYTLQDITLAKWDNSTLMVTFPSAINFKVVRARINPILEGYNCGVTIEAFQQRLYFIDTTEKQRSLISIEVDCWYTVKKDGLILKKWQ